MAAADDHRAEVEDAHGFAQAAMETALGRENFRDGLEAMGGLTDAVLWLAAETRAQRLEARGLPDAIREAIDLAGAQLATNVWEALRK